MLAEADERGVDVRGLIWRSHWEMLNFSAEHNRTLGEELQERGAEALLDMRVRTGGSHHQKMVVIRHRDDPTRDVAYVGGIDLCHSRRDTAEHLGDPQTYAMAEEYGETPPWHDVMAAISGPAVHDVETVFRERWEDPTALTRHPVYWTQDKLLRLDMTPDPLPEQWPPPPSPDDATHTVQLLRTYPNLRHGRDYPFARGGERSVARGYSKALLRARDLVYLEDQYVWGHEIGEVFTETLRRHQDLRVVAVVPLFTDQSGFMARVPQKLGRARAMKEMLDAAPGRVAVYGIENHQSTPVYVHAKVCVIDDTWASIGSDNLNRRSWTHDSELSCAVVDTSAADHSPYARRLRLTLAAEHLDRDLRGRRRRVPARGDGRLPRRAGSLHGVRRERGRARRLARRWPRGRAPTGPAASPRRAGAQPTRAPGRPGAVPDPARPRRPPRPAEEVRRLLTRAGRSPVTVLHPPVTM